MRWIVYSLILANISFFAWHFNNVERTGPAAAIDDQTVKLVLLNEAARVAESTPKSTYSCYSLGPFKLKKEASSASKRLAKWDIIAKRRTHKLSHTGYWVLLKPAKNRRAAKKNITRLKELKVQDYFLVSTGSKKYAISLGVYSKSSSAKRRLKALKKLGLKPVIETVDIPRRQYWLDWPSQQNSLDTKQLSRLQKKFQSVGQVERECQ